MGSAVGQRLDAGGMTREHGLSTGRQIDTRNRVSSFICVPRRRKHGVGGFSLTVSRPNPSRCYRHRSRHLRNIHREQARDAHMSALTATQSRSAHISRRACPMKLLADVGTWARIVMRRWHQLEAGQARHVLRISNNQKLSSHSHFWATYREGE